jgi:hypothetical protein
MHTVSIRNLTSCVFEAGEKICGLRFYYNFITCFIEHVYAKSYSKYI